MKSLLVVLLIIALLPVHALATPRTIDLETMTLEELQDLEQDVQAAIVKAMPQTEEEPSAPVESILEISKVKLSDHYSAINLEVTVKNTSKKQTVDAYSLIAYGYDAYGDAVKYMLTSDSVPLESTETIKPGKSSPKGYYWTLYNMGTLKTMKVAVVKYHTTDGEAVEIPEDQWAFVEGSK